MTATYSTGDYHTRFPTPALAFTWAHLQDAVDTLHHLSRSTGRAWWPGYAIAALEGVYAHRARGPLVCRHCGGTGLVPVTGNGPDGFDRCSCRLGPIRVTRLDADGTPTGPTLVTHGVDHGR